MNVPTASWDDHLLRLALGMEEEEDGNNNDTSILPTNGNGSSSSIAGIVGPTSFDDDNLNVINLNNNNVNNNIGTNNNNNNSNIAAVADDDLIAAIIRDGTCLEQEKQTEDLLFQTIQKINFDTSTSAHTKLKNDIRSEILCTSPVSTTPTDGTEASTDPEEDEDDDHDEQEEEEEEEKKEESTAELEDIIMPPAIVPSVKPSTTDDLIAEAMGKLSIEDRNRVMKELHGTCTSGECSETIEETPEFLEIKLLDLMEELQRTIQQQPLLSKAILLAQSQNWNFVNDNRSLHLLILRCCNFDIREASLRLIRYFDWKLFLWGPDKLCQERIYWNDLNTDEQKLFKRGFLQVLPQRDKAGRLMVMWCRCYNQFPTGFAFARLFWYMIQLQNDPESSRKGVTFVVFKEPHVPIYTMNAKEIWVLVRTLKDTPYKMTGMHKCMATGLSFVGRVMDNVVYMLEPALKQRIQMHYGTYQQWMEELATYGIPTHVISFTKDKKIKLKSHQEWTAARKVLEEKEGKQQQQQPSNNNNNKGGKPTTNTQQQQQVMVEIPSNVDVLCGRGKPITTRPGNMKFQNLVDTYIQQYHHPSTSKEQKTALATAVLQILKEDGGTRFLSKETGIWIPVSDMVAREKISGMFRHRRNEVKVQQQQQQEQEKLLALLDQSSSTPTTKKAKVHQT